MRNFVALFVVLSALAAFATAPVSAAQDDSGKNKNKTASHEKSKPGSSASQKAKPVDFGTPEGIAALKKAVDDKLGLTGEVKDKVEKLFSEHDTRLKQAVDQRQTFAKEHGEEMKKLQEEAAAAKKNNDEAKQKELAQKLETLKQQRAKIEALADPMPLLRGILDVLEPTQVDRYKSLTKEMGVDLDQDPAANVSGKDFLKAAASKDIGVDSKQKKSIEKLGKAFSEEAKKAASDKAALAQLTAKLKSDVRAVLNAEQNKKLDAMLATLAKKSAKGGAESSKGKSSSGKSSSGKSAGDKSGDQSATPTPATASPDKPNG